MGLWHAALDGGLEWVQSSLLLVERGPQLLKPSEGERASFPEARGLGMALEPSRAFRVRSC